MNCEGRLRSSQYQSPLPYFCGLKTFSSCMLPVSAQIKIQGYRQCNYTKMVALPCLDLIPFKNGLSEHIVVFQDFTQQLYSQISCAHVCQLQVSNRIIIHQIGKQFCLRMKKKVTTAHKKSRLSCRIHESVLHTSSYR